MPKEPGVGTLKLVCGEPSPQSTSTFQGLSEPESAKEPMLKGVSAPSLAVWLAGGVTCGGRCANVAIVALLPSMVTTQLLVPVQAPLQPVNVEVASGVGVKV